jgi:hypothetical protein
MWCSAEPFRADGSPARSGRGDGWRRGEDAVHRRREARDLLTERLLDGTQLRTESFLDLDEIRRDILVYGVDLVGDGLDLLTGVGDGDAHGVEDLLLVGEETSFVGLGRLCHEDLVEGTRFRRQGLHGRLLAASGVAGAVVVPQIWIRVALIPNVRFSSKPGLDSQIWIQTTKLCGISSFLPSTPELVHYNTATPSGHFFLAKSRAKP